jgi:D-glycero-D-manno-heptose 1,7-bisphosphate phosphatase
MRSAVFLDRDGTLIVDRGYLSDPAGVELLPGARETLHRLLADGHLLFLFTNQSGIGRGMFTREVVDRCNERMLELLQLPPPGFTETCIAPEAPDMPIVYRKPSPRFILEMIAKHSLDPARVWMVGDSPRDVQAGLAAGAVGVLLAAKETTTVLPGAWRCRDLADFYSRLVAESPKL